MFCRAQGVMKQTVFLTLTALTRKNVTVLNANGSRVETVKDVNRDGSLKAQTVTTTSANGLSTTCLGYNGRWQGRCVAQRRDGSQRGWQPGRDGQGCQRQRLIARSDGDDNERGSQDGYRQLHRKTAPAHLPRGLLLRIIAYRMQALALGDLDPETARFLDRIARGQKKDGAKAVPGKSPSAVQSGPEGTNVAPVPYRLRPGTQLVREHNGALHRVIVMERGFIWNGRNFASLSGVARTITGTSWNGPAFFGLRSRKGLPVAQSAEAAGKSGVSS